MTPLYPSINCHLSDDECVREKIDLVRTVFAGSPAEAHARRRVHLDIADGLFTFHKSWNDPVRWKDLAGDIEFEVHLMVEDPRTEANLWLAAGASRLIVHAETLSPEEFSELEGVCHNSGVELMLSSNPEMKAERLEGYLGMTHFFQVLAVHPGPTGQKFLPRVIEKIRFIRSRVPEAIIEVDGGVDPEVATECIEAGATELVAGAYIFESANPAKAFTDIAQLNLMSR